MNSQSSFDKFLHFGGDTENYDLNRQMLETDGIDPDLYERIGLLKRAPIPFSIECLTCDQYATIVHWNKKIVAFCPCCGRYEPLEEELIWWNPCFTPIVQSLYTGFNCTEGTECLIPNILWKLGRCALAGQSRVIYVARGINSGMNRTIVDKLPENKTSLLFVFGSLPEKGMCGTFDADKVFSINSLVTLEETGFSVNTAPVKEALDILNPIKEMKKRGPGRNAKIGDLQVKLKKRLLNWIHGVYSAIEHHERTGTDYTFHVITQKELAEQFEVDPSMVCRAIKGDGDLKLLLDIARNRDEAYIKGKCLEKNGY